MPNDKLEHELSFASEFAALKVEVATIGAAVKDLTFTMKELQRPKTTNWLAIAGFGLAAATAIFAYGAMWIEMRLKPVELQLQAEVMRNNKFEEKVQREFEWNWNYREARKPNNKKGNK